VPFAREGVGVDQRLSASAIFARLGEPARDADFELVACDRCGRQALLDHEYLRLYPDPSDLRVYAPAIEGGPWPPCRGVDGRTGSSGRPPEWRPSGGGRAGQGDGPPNHPLHPTAATSGSICA
jgi:hypothetical protein